MDNWIDSFNAIDPKIWNSNVLELYKNGPTYIMKAVISGFDLANPLEIGPIKLRNYKYEYDKKIGGWEGAFDKYVIMELKYCDDPISAKQQHPVSMHVTPMYLFRAFYYSLTSPIHDFSEHSCVFPADSP